MFRLLAWDRSLSSKGHVCLADLKLKLDQDQDLNDYTRTGQDRRRDVMAGGDKSTAGVDTLLNHNSTQPP